MHRQQAGHDSRILFRRPGHHLGFDVVGENGVEHRVLLRWAGRIGCLLQGRFGPDHPDIWAATKHSGNTIYRMALERAATSPRLTSRTRADAPGLRLVNLCFLIFW